MSVSWRGVLLALELAVALAPPFALAPAAQAQESVALVSDDPIYRDVDRLVDAGLVDRVVIGQRPYSLRMIAAIAAQAQRRLNEPGRGLRADGLDRVALRRVIAFVAGPRQRLVRSLRADLLATDAEARAIPENGLGTSEAFITPLTSQLSGRRYPSGTSGGFESEHWLALAPQLTVQLRPRLSAAAPRGARDGELSVTLLDASARLVAGNVALSAGRQETVWAQEPGAGLFFSTNGPALDMLRIASDVPFALPSLLRVLGPVAATLQLADLGASASNSHSLLVAYKLSVQPARDVEIGGSFANHFGGAGARNPSVLNRLADLLPFVDIFRHHADSTDFDSDKLLGLDGRLRLRRAGNLAVFGEVVLEDFDVHRLRSIFTEDAAYTVGVTLPQLFVPSLSTTLTYHTLGIRFYEHHLVRNGITANGLILGNPLGRDASGVTASVQWDGSNGLALSASGAMEQRRNDSYSGSYTQPDLTGLVFRRVSFVPTEQTARAMFGARWRRSDGHVVIDVRTGVEHTRNPASVEGLAQVNGIAAITATAYR